MINLLPTNLIRENRARYRERYWIVALYLLLSLMVIAVLVGASSHWLMYQDYREQEKRSDNTKNKVEAREYVALSEALKHSLDQLTVLEMPKQLPLSLVRLVALLDQYQNPGISLESVSYAINEADNVIANVSGLANTRSSLLTFINALKSDPQLETVTSPIDNLIKDRDAAFTLEVRLKPAAPFIKP